MSFDRVIGNLGIKTATLSVLGSTSVYIDQYNAATGQNIPGKYDVHTDSSGQWYQLVGILQYCGVGINTVEMAEAWFKAQTQVSFINAIRKYLEEVFFPGLTNWLNQFLASGGTPTPPADTLNDLPQAFSYILANMNVELGADGKIVRLSI